MHRNILFNSVVHCTVLTSGIGNIPDSILYCMEIKLVMENIVIEPNLYLDAFVCYC